MFLQRCPRFCLDISGVDLIEVEPQGTTQTKLPTICNDDEAFYVSSSPSGMATTTTTTAKYHLLSESS